MIEVLSRDVETLPGDLLERCKSHLRLYDQSDDDLDVEDMIAAAIEEFERVSGITIYSTTYVWTPDSTEFCGSPSFARLPMTPVGVWNAKADPDATDVSASYSVHTNGIHGVQQYYISGAWVSGLAITVSSGFTSNTLPAGIRRAIFQATATLYEYREILVPSNLQQLPGWLSSMLAGYWQPRV